MSEKILVTTALPYANGSIHLGHVLEGIQADIWVRYNRAIGNKCYFFCADDTHGTPIMLAAKKANKTPDEYIKKVHDEHYKDLTSFGISYDLYYTTNSEENKKLAEEIYLRLKEKGNISDRNIQQTYCEHDKMFLPDRFIKGTCPKCGAKDQYGDSCEVCGATYSPTDLLDPHCAICGNVPVLKESKHLFFRLQDYQAPLENWLSTPGRLQEGAKKKLLEWFETGLQEWDISRDGPYFGFEIPGEVNKFFYVWLDAPVGYMAASRKFFETNEEEFNSIWRKGEGQIVHFIGKDILYFHGLFWPAMLMGAEFTTPNKLYVHGFMTVGGEKMSKSRGTFVNASTFAKHLDTEHFRFYMAARLGSGMDDVDISFDDYLSRVNSDLIGNLVNIVSRVSTSILDKLDRRLGTLQDEGKSLFDKLLASEENIRKNYEERNYHRVMREVASLGDQVNKYVNDNAPWVLVKNDPEKARKVVTTALNCAKILFLYLYPVIPKTTQKVINFLGIEGVPDFSIISQKIENIQLPAYEHITQRANEKGIQDMIEETKNEYDKAQLLAGKNNPSIASNQPDQTGKSESKGNSTDTVTNDGYISIEDLSKVELRVGHIKDANHVEGADKLLQVTVDLGEHGSKNVFAGIKSAYKPEDLVGLKVVVVANLKPRKMKFGMSEAMLLASGNGETLSLFIPHRDANPGDLLK
ncbi:methionine--tRNA ligase [Leptospira sp. GIMC2001]|uniref:methionine--tRNA ligase n=1 Tax=Leptospira sp. GIMC2001 TaxID=1513297 RepID=UPI00234B4949|nr:methionine--tRNA ligase [Leptospira sp. GIMC2001]WCL49065.1 methionine--tRNA ligase [Leptospira sp. GIMC2001]